MISNRGAPANLGAFAGTSWRNTGMLSQAAAMEFIFLSVVAYASFLLLYLL